MAKIAVIGEKTSVFGFSALGCAVYPAQTEEEARAAFKSLLKEEAGVIYITEKTAALIPEEIEKVRFQTTPAVILIPGLSGNTGKGVEEVEKSVEKAVGSKII